MLVQVPLSEPVSSKCRSGLQPLRSWNQLGRRGLMALGRTKVQYLTLRLATILLFRQGCSGLGLLLLDQQDDT